jgi:hypothetical protein
MNLRRIVCSALLMSGLASATWARDICLENSGEDYIVLKKVKSLHPGGSVPLTGFRYYLPDGYPSPVDGSAVMRSDGTIVAGLFVHNLAAGPNNFTLEWTTDATFAGAMNFDANGDFKSDGGAIYKATDCKSVPLP